MFGHFRKAFTIVGLSIAVRLLSAIAFGQETPAKLAFDVEDAHQLVGVSTSLPPRATVTADLTGDFVKGSESAIVESQTPKQPSPDWRHLQVDSLQFLVFMNSFRIATEPGTRAALHNPLFSGYFKAVSNMHGWDDGDELYVNYIGHPMQGAVSTFVWMNNDKAFNRDHIGWNTGYAKSKIRAGAYAFVLSELFELGPLSEASIGQIQRYHPATGFVDHVVTPAVGVFWSIGEDAIDDSLVRYIENNSQNKIVKILARSTFNPARTFANLMSRKVPWERTNRPRVTAENSGMYYTPEVKDPVSPPPGVAPFQFNMHFESRTYLGKGASDPCVGGGAELGFRIADNWQIVGEITGCKQTGMSPNFSGDTLTYAGGPQWTGRLSQRWVSHARLLMGGNKVSQEQFFPAIKQQLEQEYKTKHVFPPLGSRYTRSYDNNAFAIVAGAGLDYKLNRALSFRSSLDYSHSWNRDINDINYRDSLRLSSGLVLSMGTW
jgi:hypothetical protein